MAQVDLFMREDPSHKGDVARHIFILDSVPQSEHQDLILEGIKQIEEQYVTSVNKNFSTAFSKKNFAKLQKAWEESGCQQKVITVTAQQLEEISFQCSLEDVPVSFYTKESKYIVAGPFFTATLNDLL